MEKTIRRESDFTKPSSVCPNPGKWGAIDEWGVEIEVANFLRELVVTIKPKKILETGTWPMVSTRALALGCIENEGGVIYSYEPNPKFYKRVLEEDLLYKEIIFHNMSFLEDIPRKLGWDLAFLDSGHSRLEELYAIRHAMSKNGIIILHDAWRYINSHIVNMFQRVFLPTPRGIVILQ